LFNELRTRTSVYAEAEEALHEHSREAVEQHFDDDAPNDGVQDEGVEEVGDHIGVCHVRYQDLVGGVTGKN
jgi:hypothetical protein